MFMPDCQFLVNRRIGLKQRPDLFGCMNMYGSHTDSLTQPAKGRWNRKILVSGVLVLAGIALIALLFVFKSRDNATKPVAVPVKDYAAELVSATGTVFVGKPGRTEWNQVTVGAHLTEGDLVQTDKLGEASIRYTNGNTVSIQASTIFAVRKSGDGSMEIGVPYQDADMPSTAMDSKSGTPADPSAKSNIPPGASASAKVSSPFIKLDRIVPFGRSLELIGSVEAGSRLTVNNESVDVAGDGSFKHFTNPFPAADRIVHIVMKVTNLAGHTRVITTTHDFNPQGGEN
jgi:hypothetical protein